MATKPGVEEIREYMGSTSSTWETSEIMSALAAESAAQGNRCRVPADDAEWPADLAEALCRRVLVNLSLRSKPLALESSISEVGVGFARVGGRDPEVNRLEAPYRRLVVG